MPVVNDEYREQSVYAKQRRQVEEIVLPPDFTGQIYQEAQREGKIIRARIYEIDIELERLTPKLEKAQAEYRSKLTIIYQPGQVKDILDDEIEITPPRDRGARMCGPEALKVRKEKVNPLLSRKETLEREKRIRNQELSELRKIAKMATHGDVALLHFLSDKWRSRIVVGSAVYAQLPKPARLSWGKNTIHVDAAGNPFPPEALGSEGRPDLPPRKVPK